MLAISRHFVYYRAVKKNKVLNDTAKVQIKFEKRTFGDVYFGNEAFSYDVSGLFFLMTSVTLFEINK